MERNGKVKIMKKLKWLKNDIGVDSKVYNDILKHCKDLEYNTSGFTYSICGSFDTHKQVLRFMIENVMISPIDLVNLDKDTDLDNFISEITFTESKSRYEFVLSDNQWYLLTF
jgi:hypothetical protein